MYVYGSGRCSALCIVILCISSEERFPLQIMDNGWIGCVGKEGKLKF